ncbi:GATA zinc finger-domain-containing protein [Circinella umbellata]|nr:GATA zinc finger-domain-containing protein [Circinella umbellata]
MTSVSMEQTNSTSATSSTTSSLRDPLSTSPEYVMIRRARNLQDSIGVRQSYRRRAKKAIVGQRCHSCHTAETPEWRRGPDGARTLCNACGLHYSKLIRRGSLTVQRSYSIEDAHSDRSTPPPTPPKPPPPPRVIEYPVQGAVLSSTQLRFPNRVGLGIGSITTGSSSNSPSTTITTSSSSTSIINHLHSHSHSQHQQVQQQHNTPFINYMSPSSTEYYHPKDDPP